MPYHLATSTVKVNTTLPLAETAPATRSNYLRLSLALPDLAFIKTEALALGLWGALRGRTSTIGE